MVSSVFVHPGIDKVGVLAQCSLAGSCVHKAMSVQLQRLGWNGMGNNITCTIDPTTLAPTLSLPSSFDPAKPLKLHTHGFMDTTAGEGTLSKHTYFVNAWMDKYGGDHDVILVDWHNLAWFLQITSWDDYFYDLAARNSIDVGEFVGRCLAGVIQQHGTPSMS